MQKRHLVSGGCDCLDVVAYLLARLSTQCSARRHQNAEPDQITSASIQRQVRAIFCWFKSIDSYSFNNHTYNPSRLPCLLPSFAPIFLSTVLSALLATILQYDVTYHRHHGIDSRLRSELQPVALPHACLPIISTTAAPSIAMQFPSQAKLPQYLLQSCPPTPSLLPLKLSSSGAFFERKKSLLILRRPTTSISKKNQKINNNECLALSPLKPDPQMQRRKKYSLLAHCKP